MQPQTAEVVIVGGGVMGVSTAYHLARKGVKDIVLLEKFDFFGEGSTGRCAGGIRHQFSTPVNIELSIASIKMLENFEEETGQAIDLKQVGYLIMTSDPARLDVFRKNVELQHSHGVMTEVWTPDQIAARLPMMNVDGLVGATFYDRDGIADPSGVVQGYVARARDLGVTLKSSVEVTALTQSAGRVTGVQTPDGAISAGRVVLATGAWTAPLAKTVGIDAPITPELQQCAVTTPLDWVPDDFPFVIDFDQRLYYHIEGDGLLTGQSIVGKEPTFEMQVDKDWTLHHVTNAIERMPPLAEAGLLTEWGGLYENTPDHHPIIGGVPQLEGLYMIGGFSGHGFMHGPIGGLVLAEIMEDGHSQTVDISELNFERFARGELIQEYNVI